MRVRCINNKGLEKLLTYGKEYEVTCTTNDGYFLICDDQDYANNEFLKYRFEVVKDNVNHPSHYNQGIECWDYIKSHNMDFLQGSVIKYVTRYKHKNGAEDLHKAIAFIRKILKEEYGE